MSGNKSDERGSTIPAIKCAHVRVYKGIAHTPVGLVIFIHVNLKQNMYYNRNFSSSANLKKQLYLDV